MSKHSKKFHCFPFRSRPFQPVPRFSQLLHIHGRQLLADENSEKEYNCFHVSS
jgi:hypothetical protein